MNLESFPAIELDKTVFFEVDCAKYETINFN